MKIRSIHLKNFLIIRESTVSLNEGFTAVTGETGSGKSLFVEAVRLLLGGRGTRSLAGPWGATGEASAIVEISPRDTALLSALHDLAIEPDDDHGIVVRRVIGERNAAFLNASPVPAQKLAEIFGDWIEISSQFENRELYRSDYQTAVLDTFGVPEKLRTAYEKQWHALQETRAELARLRALDDPRRRDYLSFQIEELSSFNPQEGEDADLEQRIRIAENRKRLEGLAARADEALSQADTALTAADRALGEMARITDLKDLPDRTAAILIECRDISRTLTDIAQRLTATDDEEELRARHDTLNRLLLKHGVRDAAGLIAVWRSLEKEASDLAETPARLAALEEKERSLIAAARKTAAAIHEARMKAAPKLEKKITGHLKTLGMPEVVFRVVVTPQEDLSASGADTVRFMVNTIGTGDLRDIKTLSGGELSRLLLALKLVDQEEGKFILFDEIDANIGGETAAHAAEQLRESAARNQILVVTHFPQTAACAGTHIVVEKVSERSGSPVETRLREVSGDERIREVARMMGDAESKENLKAAHKLLEKRS